MEPERTTGEPSATLQSRLESPGEDHPRLATGAPVVDPVAILHELDASGRFHRDGRFGRLFHRGMVSLRENVADDSLHLSVDDNRLTAHVDSVSPLTRRSDGASTYSARRALAHNLSGMTQDLLWLVRGRQGDHRCELNCEWIAPQAGHDAGDLDLLDPEGGAWSVQIEARVAGSLDEARLRAALAVALGCDLIEHAPLQVADCEDDDALHAARAGLQNAGVAPGSHPPLRACLVRHSAGDVLMLNVNHAASDGFGALQVLQSIARAYAGAEQVAPLDFLATLDLPVRPAAASTPAAARAYKKVVARLRDVRDRPARLAAEEAGADPGCGYHLVALSAEETRDVVGVEHARANTNVLMAALHLAIADWNDRHGAGGRRIGVLVQADLRPPQWDDGPVANLSVTARVSTTPAEREDPSSALETVSTQIARNKRARRGVALIAGLERVNLLALWAKQSIVVLQPLTGNQWVDTTVLCNLGWVEDAPSFGPDAGEAVELWLSTPARTPLSLTLGALTVGGRLHLSFRYPHRLLGPDAARRFADCYVDHLRAVGAVRP